MHCTLNYSVFSSAITGQPNYTLSHLFTYVLMSLIIRFVWVLTHITANIWNVTNQKLFVKSHLSSWGNVVAHTHRGHRRNQNKLPSLSIFPDGNPPSKSYHIYVCQDKLQGKQKKFCSLFSRSSLDSTGGCTELCEVQYPRKRRPSLKVLP